MFWLSARAKNRQSFTSHAQSTLILDVELKMRGQRRNVIYALSTEYASLLFLTHQRYHEYS